MALTLKIYTMEHCPTCESTRNIASGIARRLPGISVELIDLEQPGTVPPPEVFSVPTYVLNGNVISLGNPYLDQLERSIRQFSRTT